VFSPDATLWEKPFLTLEDMMMNEIGYPFHVDPVVTEQFFGHFSNPGSAGPERELLIAILADALECYCKYSRSCKNVEVKLFQEAREWIFAENEDTPLSFVSVCDALTLNPNYLRHRLLDQESYGFTRGQKKAENPFRKKKLGTRGKKRSGPKGLVRRGRRSESK